MLVLVIIAALVGLFLLGGRLLRPSQHRPEAPSEVIVPPGTATLDDVDAVRPDIAAGALEQTRAAVTSEVPDSVLADALLDASPDQLRQLFAAVPADVMAAAVGAEGTSGTVGTGDRTQLSGLSAAVDDLDIWSFGETEAR
ncbi:hypothetical protein [Deinococcus sonorensis]|uniref:Magnesium transporter MgtE intracellular domain-containing protein n=2 Tax=Deinococcus sonorensis TaxID=309891 RepID=A0AAU7U4W0_9DEIO